MDEVMRLRKGGRMGMRRWEVANDGCGGDCDIMKTLWLKVIIIEGTSGAFAEVVKDATMMIGGYKKWDLCCV